MVGVEGTERQVAELIRLLPELKRALLAQHDQHTLRTVCESLPPRVLEAMRNGSPPTQAQVQVALELAQDGPATVGDLAHRLGVSAPAVSLQVDRMAEHGMVERLRDTDDRRVVWVRLTPAAQSIAGAFLGFWRAQLETFLAQVPEGEREAFVRNATLFARVLGPSPEVPATRPLESRP